MYRSVSESGVKESFFLEAMGALNSKSIICV